MPLVCPLCFAARLGFRLSLKAPFGYDEWKRVSRTAFSLTVKYDTVHGNITMLIAQSFTLEDMVG